MRKRLRWLSLWLVLVAPAAASELEPGDILLLDSGLDAVLRIDPETGDRRVVTSNEVGSGPELLYATDLEFGDDGGLVVVDRNAYQILRIDLASGDRIPLIERERVRALGALRGLARRAEGGFWLTRSARRTALYGLDPRTGETWELSPRLAPRDRLRIPVAVVDDGTRLLVADSKRGVLEIDLESGEGRRFAAAGAEGSPLGEPFDLVRGRDGALWLADKAGPALLQLDPVSGAARVVSGAGVGAGEPFAWPTGVAVEADGGLLVADRIRRAVFRVDPASGERRVVSSPEVGSGPGPGTPRQLLVVPGRRSQRDWPVLAGASVLLLLLGVGAWLQSRRRGAAHRYAAPR